MARPFIVRPLAEADIESVSRWYDKERTGLAARFVSDLDRTFMQIRESGRTSSPQSPTTFDGRSCRHSRTPSTFAHRKNSSSSLRCST
jgi:hypothetical protein